MKYDELVKALRICEDGDCSKCTYQKGKYDCDTILVRDSADAIEALEHELNVQKNMLENLLMSSTETLIPKRGEWIEHGEPPMLVIECSVCGQKYFNHALQEKAKYCSMCGAKMEETNADRLD